MRLYFNEDVATPSGCYSQGERYDVPDKIAMGLIETGSAENEVIWLAKIASEIGFDIKPAKKSKKLEDYLSF